MEKEIEKELWKGNIAVVIKLHKDDVTSLEEIPPLLVRFCFNFEIACTKFCALTTQIVTNSNNFIVILRVD